MPIINLDEVLSDPIFVIYKGQKYEMAEADEEDYLRLARWGELATQKDADALKSIRGEVQEVLKHLLPDFPWGREQLPFPALAAITMSLSSRLGEQMKAVGISGPPPEMGPKGEPIAIQFQPAKVPQVT